MKIGGCDYRRLAGWPTLVHSLFFLFPYQNTGAPSLRFVQGWAAMLLIA